MANAYTARWFDLFLRPLDPRKTALEIEFLRRQLPPPRAVKVIDLCCGPGRHAHPLAGLGYIVTGIDRDTRSIAEARESAGPNETYIEHDMRFLPELGLHANAVLCLWQSFGYFDAATNRAVLAGITAMLPARGRCILDLYQREFFESHQGTRTYALREHQITETTQMMAGRLSVSLTEGDARPVDTFDWQLFTPEECIALAGSVGLSCVLTCTNYDERQPADKAQPRLQYVFEKQISAL